MTSDQRKIRILHVIPGLEKDGAEYQMALNATLLDKSRFENHVCHLFPRTELKAFIAGQGIRVHSAVAQGRIAALGRLRNVVRLVRSLEIDVIHGSNVQGELYGGLAGLITHVPAVATLTNIAYEPVWLVDNPNLNRRKLFIVDQTRKCVLKRLHRKYIAISEYVMQSGIKDFGLDKRKFKLIYRGLPASQAGPDNARLAALRESLGINGAYPVMLNVGRLVPQKGQRYLIEAMAEVVRAYPHSRLLIAGEGFLDKRLIQLRDELGLKDAVTFLGRRQDVYDLLAISDMFVFPSLFEGFGVALLEAAAAGKPCVASNSGPLPEVLDYGKAGVLVEPQNSTALAASMMQVAGDRELQKKIGDAASRRAASVFDIRQSVRKLEEFYEEVVAAA